MVHDMRTFLLAAVVAIAAGPACSKAESDQAAARESKLKQISIDEVDQLVASGACTPVDANSEKTRKRHGVVPGAVLLTDSEVYKLSELPADKTKPLVFYCANTHCTASHEAANRALLSGYTNVRVMGEGISGWVKAGKKVQTL